MGQFYSRFGPIVSSSSFVGKTPGFGAVKFIPNLAGIAALEVTPAMVEQMRQKAQSVVDEALQVWESSGPHPYETGDYKNSLRAEAGVEGHRAVGRANAYDFKAWWLEYGTSDTPAFAPLTRGAEEAGLHVSKAKRGFV